MLSLILLLGLGFVVALVVVVGLLLLDKFLEGHGLW